MVHDVHRSIIIFNRRGFSSVSIDVTGCASINCFFFVSISYVDHPDTAAYPEEFIAGARAVALLPQDRWENITVEKIRRLSDRISRRDWRSDLLPVITGKKRRFSLFFRAEQRQICEAKNLPDLSALLGSRLGGSSSNRPPTAPVMREEPRTAVEPSVSIPESTSIVPSGKVVTKKPAGPSTKTGKGKKRPASDSSAATGQEGSSEAVVAETQSDEPPKKKTKKPKKKKKIVQENDREVAVQEDSSDGARTGGDQDGSPITPLTRKKKEKRADNWAASNALVVTEQGEKSGEEIPPPPVVEFKYDGDTPLSYAPDECAELIRQIRGGAKNLPKVKDLIFKDAYIGAARTKVMDVESEPPRTSGGPVTSKEASGFLVSLVLEISDYSQEDQSGSADERRDIEPAGDDAGVEPTELGIAVNEEAVSTEKQIEPKTRRSLEAEPTSIEEMLPTEKDGDEAAIASSEVPKGTSIPDGATGE
ncbi:hypothetical protein F2Q69_00005431 [Brassica cretica]|uniref:Uncharacterized protein n=1 Tax=Brassica cretica TaxID=69181 RepID=A0A8S9PHU2_BRACR|nr:hypothetical protein F2Q69_00005431 [Brassica cretica]